MQLYRRVPFTRQDYYIKKLREHEATIDDVEIHDMFVQDKKRYEAMRAAVASFTASGGTDTDDFMNTMNIQCKYLSSPPVVSMLWPLPIRRVVSEGTLRRADARSFWKRAQLDCLKEAGFDDAAVTQEYIVADRVTGLSGNAIAEASAGVVDLYDSLPVDADNVNVIAAVVKDGLTYLADIIRCSMTPLDRLKVAVEANSAGTNKILVSFATCSTGRDLISRAHLVLAKRGEASNQIAKLQTAVENVSKLMTLANTDQTYTSGTKLIIIVQCLSASSKIMNDDPSYFESLETELQPARKAFELVMDFVLKASVEQIRAVADADDLAKLKAGLDQFPTQAVAILLDMKFYTASGLFNLEALDNVKSTMAFMKMAGEMTEDALSKKEDKDAIDFYYKLVTLSKNVCTSGLDEAGAITLKQHLQEKFTRLLPYSASLKTRLEDYSRTDVVFHHPLFFHTCCLRVRMSTSAGYQLYCMWLFGFCGYYKRVS